jgi:hypothetical protein
MQFLAQSHAQPHATVEAMTPHLTAEAAEAWRCYLDGTIRQAYFRTPPAAPGAVLIIEADSLDFAQRLVDAMPLRQAGLVTFEVTPIGPFLPWTALLAAPADTTT